MDDYFAFVDPVTGHEVTTGMIVHIFYENHGNGAYEKLGEPVCESIQELVPIFNYIKSQFPKGWKVENGKVVGI